MRSKDISSRLHDTDHGEVLYHPEKNEIVIFNGAYEVDVSLKHITIYVLCRDMKGKNKSLKISPRELVHIGWL